MNHNWYAVITANVLLSKEISSTQKLLIALIGNLSNEKGYCYATNAYLAECLDVSPITISQNISDLEDKGFVGRVIYYNETKNVEQRFLTLIEKPIPPPLKTNTPLLENHNPPPIKNLKGNNKVFKNKPNNKYYTILSEQKFERFWDLYDKKQDMQKCKDKFCKLSEQEQNRILEVVCLYVAKTPDKQFRKNPLTWLNGKCWLDDYSDVQVKTINPKPERKQFFLTTEYEQAVAEWEAKNKPSGLHDIQGHLL